MGAEFVRGRLCQGPSLLGAEMSRNRYNIFQYLKIVSTFPNSPNSDGMRHSGACIHLILHYLQICLYNCLLFPFLFI